MKRLRHTIIFFILTAQFTTGCQSTPPDPAPDATPNPPAAQIPDTDIPHHPQELTPAQQLAKKVFIAHGGPALSTVTRIHFTFDVQTNDTSVMAAEHDWNLTQNTDQIQWTTPDGTRLDLHFNLESGTVDGTSNDTPITDEQRAHLAPDAYRRWVNDTYWLLMPLKLQDPGVHLTLEEPRTIDTKSYHVLHMTFENVGLTPGDQYWIYIDPNTNHITRWDMLLQGQTTEPTTVLWQNYQSIGPLNLPTLRSWPDGFRQIVFEDTQIYTHD